MSDIYAPPSASLDDEPAISDGSHKFYVVGPLKFIALYAFTFGLYKVYWFYKNWSRYKAGSQEDMWPVMRGIFSIFFTHSLFRNVNETIGREGSAHAWDPEILATFYVIAQIGMAVMDRLPKFTDHIVVPLEIFVMLPLIGFLLYRAQLAVNAACGDPSGATNSKLTWANFAWMAVGLIVIVLAVIGMVVDIPTQQ